MKTLKCLFVLIAFVGLLFVGCSEKSQPISPTDQAATTPALNKVNLIQFTATDELGDYTVFGDIKGSGLRDIYKGWEGDDALVSSEPLVNGVAHIELNGALDANGNGPVYGKFTITPDDPAVGGIWEGTWEGSIKDGVGQWKLVATGNGGIIQGMMLFATETLVQSTYAGTVEGYIQSH
jgi:hypothetical protein